MKFVAKCSDCGEQRILNEWGRCKSCFDKWLEEMRDIVYDDPQGPQPDPAKVEEAVARMRELESREPDPEATISDIGNDIVDEFGPTEKAAKRQRQINLAMREIFLKYSKQSTYPNLSKPPEKI